jgi:glycoside hydrolase-like protein
MTVIDYSNWRPPSAQTLVQHGVTGVVRYIAPKAWGWPKAITVDELAQLHAAGLSVAFNFEKSPGDYQGGTAAGRQNGIAIDAAMVELGVPLTVPVYVSYDTEIPHSQYALVLDYHRAVLGATRGRPIDAYGQNDLLEFLAGKGVLSRGWMSESTSFPGNDSPKAHTVLQQHYGQQIAGLPGAYDMNTVISSDWGQHPRPSAPLPPKPMKVKPMYDPPLGPIAAVWRDKDGKVLAAVSPFGDVYAWGVPFRPWPTKSKDFAGRQAAQIGPVPGDKTGKRYMVTATTGETYAP